jgi:hypothetical protein
VVSSSTTTICGRWSIPSKPSRCDRGTTKNMRGADAPPPHHNACPKGIEADSRSEPAAHGYHRAPVREVVDTPFFPRTGANRRGHHALSLAPSVSCFGRNEHGVSVWRLARCHDTDDTNRGCGDIPTIRWMVKMARSETFEMSIDWRPERRPLSEWRYETVPTEPPPSRTRIMAAVHDLAWKPTTSRRLWDRRSRPLPGQPWRNPSM